MAPIEDVDLSGWKRVRGTAKERSRSYVKSGSRGSRSMRSSIPIRRRASRVPRFTVRAPRHRSGYQRRRGTAVYRAVNSGDRTEFLAPRTLASASEASFGESAIVSRLARTFGGSNSARPPIDTHAYAFVSARFRGALVHQFDSEPGRCDRPQSRNPPFRTVRAGTQRVRHGDDPPVSHPVAERRGVTALFLVSPPGSLRMPIGLEERTPRARGFPSRASVTVRRWFSTDWTDRRESSQRTTKGPGNKRGSWQRRARTSSSKHSNSTV